MGIEKGIFDEHGVLYVGDKSQNSATETNIIWTLNKNLNKKKKNSPPKKWAILENSF